MNFIEVNDIDLPEVQIYQRLRENAFSKDGSFIADSPKVVNLLIESGVEIKSIFAAQEYYDTYRDFLANYTIPVAYVAPKTVLEQIVGHRLHHNVMMHGVRPKESTLDALGNHIIMLDEISNTDNIGSIARSAAALDVGSLLLPRQGPHPYARRALRVSMGHIGKLKFHRYDNIKETIQKLKKMGYRIFAAEVTKDSTPLSQVRVPGKWALLMGHEQLGISDEILALCDEVVTIEMEEGIKSFNVAVAASIMMYRFKHT
ncbi:TrmH family RNA methyltransferase [Sulfurovum sp. NBC37-1]|uniref:TrmH family RNA methyltransferase n=1 Tax=Sulfurovum sp. (strain NBC37-1) TaxID=387093 RepID=UPI0001587BB1|nr:RNA methyltransferase [Sulfurovum sp. NBC37-1]BAF72513.1 tRNA/rRNA methyltransferase [Sulfurovum sp. NBC37-1]